MLSLDVSSCFQGFLSGLVSNCIWDCYSVRVDSDLMAVRADFVGILGLFDALVSGKLVRLIFSGETWTMTFGLVFSPILSP